MTHPPHIRIYDYILRLSVITLTFLTPIICLTTYGYLHSLSSYWNTPLQPLFIFALASTSYYLFGVKNWRLSALMLLGLVAFSVEMWPMTHNVIAGLFFVGTLYPLWKTNHFKWAFWVYLISLPMLAISMMAAEMVAIWTLCIHQGLMVHKLYKLSKDEMAIKKNI